MTISSPTQLEEIALDWVTCFYCEAGYRQWCKTRSGSTATFLHSCRLTPLQMAYGQGYVDADFDYRQRVAS